MSLFSRKAKPNDDLDLRLSKLEREVRDLYIDWTQTYEKFSRMYARLHKRLKDEQKRAEDDSGEPIEAAGDGRHTTNPLAARLLNPYGGTR